jgi:hypothetical protein
LADELSSRVDSLGPGIGWEFSGGPDGKDCFTLSGEGNLHLQLLTIFAVERAPKVEGWIFYPGRQSKERASCLQIEDQAFRQKEFWIEPIRNAETENIDIRVWHPLLNLLPEKIVGRHCSCCWMTHWVSTGRNNGWEKWSSAKRVLRIRSKSESHESLWL